MCFEAIFQTRLLKVCATKKCVFLIFMSSKMSDLEYTDSYLGKVFSIRELLSYSSTEGGDVSALL